MPGSEYGPGAYAGQLSTTLAQFGEVHPSAITTLKARLPSHQKIAILVSGRIIRADETTEGLSTEILQNNADLRDDI